MLERLRGSSGESKGEGRSAMETPAREECSNMHAREDARVGAESGRLTSTWGWHSSAKLRLVRGDVASAASRCHLVVSHDQPGRRSSPFLSSES